MVEMLRLLPQEYSQELVVGLLGSFHFDMLSWLLKTAVPSPRA